MSFDPGLIAGADALAGMNDTGFDELRKALTAGYGTDVSTLTGGAALRIQSLDMTMQATIQDKRKFRLFNKLPKPKVGATIDEWTEMSSVGGFLGGSTNSEAGVINQATGQYNRRFGMVKFLMCQRQVSLVAQLQNSIVEAEAIEYKAGALQLLTDAEFLCFEGNSACVPTEFDGIRAQMTGGVASGQVPSDHVIDMRAGALNNITAINQAAQLISGYGNFGQLTDIFTSQGVQADFDNSLDPAWRIALSDRPGSTAIGTPVRGLNTSWGEIATNSDVFIREGLMLQPFEVIQVGIATSNVAIKPQAVAGAVANNANSQFLAAQAGQYYYYVTGKNQAGQSTGTVSAQVAVGSGQAVTLTITGSAGLGETAYVISRSRLNGGNSVAGSVVGQGSDFREMITIPASGGANTVYVDVNADIPGCTTAYLLNMEPGDTAILWRQMLPMLKFSLYPTNTATIPWAQLLFGYLRMSKRKQHAIIKNILPKSAVWLPFNAQS